MLATHNPITFDKENTAGGVMRTKQAQKPGLSRGRSFGVEVSKNAVAPTENSINPGKPKAKQALQPLQRTRSALGDITNSNAQKSAQPQNKKIMKQAVVAKTSTKAKQVAVAAEEDWAFPLPPEKPYEDPFIESVDLPALARMPVVSFDFGSSPVPTFEEELPLDIEFIPVDDSCPPEEDVSTQFWGIPAPIEVAIDSDF